MRYWGHHMSDIVYESPDKDGFSKIEPYATDSYSLVLNYGFILLMFFYFIESFYFIFICTYNSFVL